MSLAIPQVDAEADVHSLASVGYSRFLSDKFNKCFYRFRPGFPACSPKFVVDVFAPNLTEESVEFFVVIGNFCRRNRTPMNGS